MGGTTLITGGAGYIGMLAAEQLLEAGHEVRVLDSLLHGQEDLAASLRERGVELIVADVRDGAARGEALRGADPSSTWRRSSAIPRARSTPRRRRRSTSTPRWRWSTDARRLASSAS